MASGGMQVRYGAEAKEAQLETGLYMELQESADPAARRVSMRMSVGVSGCQSVCVCVVRRRAGLLRHSVAVGDGWAG